MTINSQFDDNQYQYHRVPTPNSVIENQLFSKTCRPSSLASDSVFQNSSSVLVSTPKVSDNFDKIAFSQSMNSHNSKSFVNLKKTISEIDGKNQQNINNKIFLKTNGKSSKINYNFTEIYSEKDKEINLEKKTEENGLFERTNEIFEEKIEICESKIIIEDQFDSLVKNKKSKCENIVDSYTSEVFQILLNEILEEISKNN